MRYMNWDVLVFPGIGDSNTPLQEFSTACTVIQDPAINNAAVPMPGPPTYFKTVTHPLPTVTCFVPSLLPGSPFKVSIHSWADPVASRATQAMAAQGNSIWYDARVLLDGVCSAFVTQGRYWSWGILFSQEAPWPQIIAVDKENKHERLHFPPFPEEMLTQVWANPTQGMGTIRVVIAEGINHGSADNVAFVRLRNIVTFSFQHAPLHTLENCGIAWPNPGMWWQGQQQFYNITSPCNKPADAESHAHSPRRHRASLEASEEATDRRLAPPHMSQGLTAHPAFRARVSDGSHAFPSQQTPIHDPFTGGAASNNFYKTVATRSTTTSGEPSLPAQSRSTSSSHDESMPDCSRRLSPGSSSYQSYHVPDHSALPSETSRRSSYPMPDYSRPPTLPGSRQASNFSNATMNELGFSTIENMLQSNQDHDVDSQFNDMMASFSPRKTSNMSGISAPSNTRVNSAANSPPIQSDAVLRAPKDRVASYSNLFHADSAVTHGPPLQSTHKSGSQNRVPSNLGRNVSPSLGESPLEIDPQPATTIKKKPVGRPKGRKEGKSNDAGEFDIPVYKSQRQATLKTVTSHSKGNDSKSVERVSDGKRKRIANFTGSTVTHGEQVGYEETPSPMKKLSKTRSTESPSKRLVDLDDLTAEGVVARVPLCEIENRI